LSVLLTQATAASILRFLKIERGAWNTLSQEEQSNALLVIGKPHNLEKLPNKLPRPTVAAAMANGRPR
jgi:hypothetical protein